MQVLSRPTPSDRSQAIRLVKLMSRRDLRPLLFAVVIKPREIDQLFGVHIGDAGVDVRPHPE